MKKRPSLPIIGVVYPQAADHPSGYVDRFYWLDRMAKTHWQGKCPSCGLYTLHHPKKVKTNGQ